MNKFENFVTSIKNGVIKHSPEILVGLGITGMLGSTVTAVSVTPKAVKAIEAEKKAQDVEKLKVKDVIKTCWKMYIPTIATSAVSIACIIGASAVHTKRNAALATAYSLSESAFRTYKEKVIETIGEKKNRDVMDAVAKDKVEKTPVKSTEVIITDSGNTLCLDYTSGRYFKSDIEKLRKVQNELNRQMISDMYVSLNDFYFEIGLTPTNIGDEIGWNVNKALIDLSFSSQLTEDGTPCLVVNFEVPPIHNYQYM